MAASGNALRITALVLRTFVLLSLLASVIIIATGTVKLPNDDVLTDYLVAPDSQSGTTKLTFKNILAYRYLLSVAVIGCAYTLGQIPFAALNITKGKRFISRNVFPLYIFADVVFTSLFATGVGAGFGITVDLKRFLDKGFRSSGLQDDIVAKNIDKGLDLVYASTGLLLVATVGMVFITLISAQALAKK